MQYELLLDERILFVYPSFISNMRMRRMMLRIDVSYAIGPATQTRSGWLFFFGIWKQEQRS